MTRKALAVLFALAVLPACGSDSSPAAPPPVTTPPTTLASFSGSYVGPMDYNVGGQGVLRVTGTTTVTHSGTTISFTNLTLVIQGQSSAIPLGSATLSGDRYLGATSYQSAGCGSTVATTITRFGGRQMNLTVDLVSASCGNSHIVGELSR